METRQKTALILALAGTAGYVGYRYYRKRNSEKSAKEFVQKWLDTVCKRNSDHIADLYDGDAVLLGTVAENLATGKAEIEYYFRQFVEMMPCGEIVDSNVIINGDTAIVNGNYIFSLVDEDGDMSDNPARFTFILKQESSGWKILTHHSSANPVQEPTDTGIYGQDGSEAQDYDDGKPIPDGLIDYGANKGFDGSEYMGNPMVDYDAAGEMYF